MLEGLSINQNNIIISRIKSMGMETENRDKKIRKKRKNYQG